MIQSANWASVFEPILRGLFEKIDIGQLPDYMRQLFKEEDSRKAQETMLGLGGSGIMEEWNYSQRRMHQLDVETGFETVFQPAMFTGEIVIEKTMLDDNLYPQVKQKLTQLKETEFKTIQAHAASVFNYAGSESNPITRKSALGGDGKPLCSATHPLSPNNTSTTWSNLGALALDPDNLETTRTNMKAWTDDKGFKLGVNPNLLLVPTELRKSALIIAETKEEPYTTDHGINVWNGRLKVIEYEALTDSNAWFLIDEARMKRLLIWMWRQKPDRVQMQDYNAQTAHYGVIGRWIPGWIDPSFIYMNNPS